MIPRTINANQMRLINRSAILEYIRLNSPTSRTAIAKKLDLSMPTVMRIIDDLFDENLVLEAGQTDTGLGRKRTLIAYNKNAYSVIGIDLGGTKLYGALANIGGDILHEVTLEQHETTGEESLKIVIDMISALLSEVPAAMPMRGIAVGVPGVTKNQKGIIEWAPSLNWRDFPLREHLENHFDLPVFVDNDVNLAVLGEHWFGRGIGLNNMILISIGTGVGAGLIIDGALYRGFSKASGEIGYFVPDISALGQAYDNFGALEQIVSGTAIGRRGQEKAQEETETPITSEVVFSAAANGEKWAQDIVQETVDYMALMIANINSLLDLELVVLSGGVANQSSVLIEGIYQRIRGVIPRVPNIQKSQLGRSATAMGAIVMVVHATDSYYMVKKLS